MFIRLLMLLLLAANIGVASWLVLARPPQAAPPALTDPGVPSIVLLSERDRDAAPAAAARATSAPMEDGVSRMPEVCTSLGAFDTQADLRSAMNALTPSVERIQFRESSRTQSYGFVVFMPAQPSRDAALELARQLSGRGVRDYYVVSSGDQQNTISLGLFRDRGNAVRRQAELTGMGFAADIAERTEARPEYFLDYVQRQDRPVDWRALVPDTRDLTARRIPCF